MKITRSDSATSAHTSDLDIDPFEVLPHPANVKFLQAHSVHVMKTLGECLHRISEAEGVEWAPCFLRDFFVPVFEEAERPSETPYQIIYGSSRQKPVDLAVDVSSFTSLMYRLPHPALKVECAVSRNLEWLQTALHLSDTETKILLWTYVISHRRSENIRDAYSSVVFKRGSNVHAAVALLIDEPPQAVAECFTAPDRLIAMRLLLRGRCTESFGLDQYFIAGNLLPAVLETIHFSPEAMIQRLLEREPSWTLGTELQTPSILFYEWFDRPVADAFAATVLHQAMNSDHIVALVEWFTRMQLQSPQCEPLAGHINLTTVEQTVKECAVACARRYVPITPLLLLAALYTAAIETMR